ncbi:MAG: hypothetical protein OXU36_19880, partial [Candidatus Poribacteria bacterium]|nr:hypothetical protein [Candidatus Poribacteria bacterium]
MKRIFQCIFILSLLCMPLMSEAITVSISEVDPYWKPEASTKDNLSVAWLTVTISGIDPRRDQYKRIIISLNEVTKEKGICCNGTYADYVKDATLKQVYRSTSKDMIFRREENAGWVVLDNRRLKYEVPSDERKIKTTVTLPVGVLSLDFGGYGEVHGAVYLKKNNPSDRDVTDPSAGVFTYVKVPRDKNDNEIADSWHRDYYAINKNGQLDATLFRDFGRTDDEDTSPNTDYEGDHITAFGEYRGFLVWENKPVPGLNAPRVTHTRTSPDTKTMFVVNEDAHTTYHGTGTAVPYISQYLVPSSLVKADGWVNFNEDNGLVAFSVKVVSNTQSKGKTYGEVPSNGPPVANYEATIYTGAIKFHENSGNVSAAIDTTIGHELAHGAHLDHCPKSDLKDAKGKDKGWDKICMMWPAYDAAQNKFAKHHDVDYALAQPVKDPQTPVELDEKTGKPKPKKGKLTSSDGAYTANAGDSHTAKFTAPSAYSSVYWYVKSPSDTSTYGTSQEIDQGDGSTKTASFTYTFPTGVSGTYQILAYVYPGGGSVYDLKYTVSVEATTTTTTPGGSTTPTYSLTSANGSYTATAGGSHTANFTTSSAYSSVYWYVKSPSASGLGTNVETDTGDGSTTTTASMTYTFPAGTSG